MLTAILTAVLVVAATGLICSVLLVVAAKYFHVPVDEKEIILYRYMGKVTIPRSEITDIRPYPTKGTTIRLCGIGGCMGNVGLFRHSEIGNFTAYYTDPSRSYVIYRRSKRPIVITSVEPLE